MTANNRRNKQAWVSFFWLFLPLSMLIALGGWFIYQGEQDRDITKLRLQAEVRSRLGAEALARALKGVKEDVLVLSGLSSLSKVLESGSKTDALAADFASLASNKREYDQIRWIDESGMERVRVNYRDKKVTKVPENKLQSKADRYYFERSFTLAPGEVYVSPLDLNIEEGQIEMPFRPMLRFATPVFDAQGNRQGIIVVNYNGKSMIDALASTAQDLQGETALLNHDGFWLYSSNAEEEWGFMLPHGLMFSHKFPGIWEQLKARYSGTIDASSGLWHFQTLHPDLQHPLIFSTSIDGDVDPPFSHGWKVVVRITPEMIGAFVNQTRIKIGWATAILMVLSAIGVAVYHRQLVRAQDRDLLEREVAERTTELKTAYESLQKSYQDFKRQEQTLSDTQERVSHIINTSLNGVYIFDLDGGRYNYINPQFGLMLGLTADYLKSLDSYGVRALFHPDDLPELDQHITEVRRLKKSQVKELRFRLKHKDGHWVWCHTRDCVLDRNDAGEALTMLGSMIDMSKQIALEEEQWQQEQLLIQQSKMAALGEMMGAIAHQWRQPLTAVSGALLNLKDAAVHGDLSLDYLATQFEQAQRQLKYMSQTIDDFRLFFVPSKERKPFNTVEAMINSASIMVSVLTHHHIQVVLRQVRGQQIETVEFSNEHVVGEDHPFMVHGYKNEFLQVLVNLISNAKDAIEALYHHGDLDIGKGCITLTVSSSNEWVNMSVEDNGGGVPDEVIDKVFEPYFTCKEEGKGTGIGLYMSKVIIEKNMGGQLSVENSDTGAVFNIRLPRA